MLCWGRHTNSRVTRNGSVYGKYMASVQNVSVPSPSCISKYCAASVDWNSGNVLPQAAGTLNGLGPDQWDKKRPKGTSTCFERNLCTIPSECVKSAKLRVDLRDNLNAVKLIVSKLTTRNGPSTAAVCLPQQSVYRSGLSTAAVCLSQRSVYRNSLFIAIVCLSQRSVYRSLLVHTFVYFPLLITFLLLLNG